MPASPLDNWSGAFGDAYTLRNSDLPVAALTRELRRYLDGIETPRYVLEVGCNAGANLRALRRIWRQASLIGVEPNALARRRATAHGLIVLDGICSRLPFETGSFSLVLSAGLLIHISPATIAHSLDELVRVCRDYLLTIEYEAECERALNYRRRRGLLWERPHRALLAERGLHVITRGSCDPELYFGCEWTLYAK